MAQGIRVWRRTSWWRCSGSEEEESSTAKEDKGWLREKIIRKLLE